MKLITKNTDYAIRALVYISRTDGKYISSREIAVKDGIPMHFLRLLLQKLIKSGILISKEGAGGGVMLAKLPSEVFLKDVMEIFQGNFALSECILKKRICPRRSVCILRSKIGEIEHEVLRRIEGITIDELKEKHHEKRSN